MVRCSLQSVITNLLHEFLSFFNGRGVGCIFIEMMQGVAAFPGMKDIQDQLERIFLVSFILLCVDGIYYS